MTRSGAANVAKGQGGAEWLSMPERGSALGVRILILLATVLGRWPAGVVLRVIAFYYVAFSPRVRRTLRAYYRRLDGSHADFRRIYRHVFTFSRVALDRFFFVRGKYHLFDVAHHGREHLDQVAASGRGALLVTAHLGSQSAMSVDGAAERLRINVAGYFRNARMINDVMTRLNPSIAARVIHLEPGSATAVLDIKERIERGELVVVAADRLGVNDRFIEVDFLGDVARFPTGPFLLASMLRCPIHLTFALYRGGNRYDLYCEPFLDALDPPRAKRESAIADAVRAFAARLEAYCRMAPDNWFNFFDFWRRP